VSPLEIVLFILVLILANGLFAAAEIAVVSVRRSRIQQLLEEGDKRAKAVDKLQKDAEGFLATVQVGITVVGALASAVGGASLAEPLARLLSGGDQVPSWTGKLALGLFVVFYSFLSIVLGELVPKSIALRYAEPISLRISRLMLGLGKIARPVVWVLTASANLLLKPLRDRTKFTETRLTPEEIKVLLEEAAESGAIEKPRAEIIERAVDFGELTAADVLVPRGDIVAIDINDSPEKIRRTLLEESHTRLPVYDGSLDKVIGYVTAKDTVPLFLESELFVLQDIVRPVFFVPESMRATDLLRALQARREHLAIVVDEYGGTAGLCTTEDLVEEIVGEIFSEGATEAPMITREPQGIAFVDATLPVREFNREFDADLPEDAGFDTIGGMLSMLAGAIPAQGQVFVSSGYEFKVVERTERRVVRVRIRQLETPPESKE
jgi:putative hemolysin